MKAIIMCGLPASGKSSYVSNNFSSCVVIDDFITKEKIPVDADFLVLADPYFCLTKTREACEEYLINLGYTVEILFFENNEEQCLINSKNRPDKKVDGLIKYLSKKYEPPRIDLLVYTSL